MLLSASRAASSEAAESATTVATDGWLLLPLLEIPNDDELGSSSASKASASEAAESATVSGMCS